MKCDCPVCNGRDYNPVGIELAEREVIPFVKRDILKLKYLNHPFPRKYDGLVYSLFAYSQALAYNQAHNIQAVYYTDNKWMLMFSSELEAKFGMRTEHKDNLPETYNEVCEYNTK